MPSYTPKPWKLRGNSIIAGQGEHEYIIANVTGNMHLPAGQAAANARLIAAAPSLLEAVQQARRAMLLGRYPDFPLLDDAITAALGQEVPS